MKHLIYFKVTEEANYDIGAFNRVVKERIRLHKRIIPTGWRVFNSFVRVGLDGEDFIFNQLTVIVTLNANKVPRISRLKELKHENKRAKNRNNFPYHNVAKANAPTFHNSASPNCV
jgi:hypothetical protein